MSYVDKVRTYQKQMSLEEAVSRTVDECIAEGILADFLKANKAEDKINTLLLFQFNNRVF